MAGAPAGDDEVVALLALLGEGDGSGVDRRRPGAWASIAAQVARRGSAIALWDELHPPTLDGMDDARCALGRAREKLSGWRAAGIEVLTVLDLEYPLGLKQSRTTPPLLFVKGALPPHEVGVSVVGSRDASDAGLRMAADVARGIVERGLRVISGLAAGIDTAAHQATLAAGGRPIGVLGTGLNRTYPEANRGLHDRVAAAGALVSQFPPDYPPGQHTFPARNATMAGLGLASIIVAAAERSGSRVHARRAIEYRRPLILADTVVATTQWGTEFQHRSRVHVAGSAAEILAIIDELVGDVRLHA